jgi:hypothetical protein
MAGASQPASSGPRASGWLRALGLGCGFLAFGGFCIVGLSARMIVAQLSDATGAASGFLADVRAGDWASAHQRMSAAYQRDHDAAHLQREVARISPLHEHLTALLTSTESSDDGERTTVEGALYGPFGEAAVAVQLSKDGGYWYVDLVVVDGRALE